MNLKEDDPVYSCEFYLENGCSHVDGYLCKMSTCNILEEFKLRNSLNKPKRCTISIENNKQKE